MMSWRVAMGLATLSFGAALLAGCGGAGSGVRTVDVSGTLTVDDKPLEGIDVFFISTTSSHTGCGRTGPDGKYRLDGSGNAKFRGATPGKNMISFSRPVAAAAASQAPPDMPPIAAPAAPAKEDAFLAKPMTFDVPERGTAAADFKLSRK